jgi:hypothetical protein
MCGYGNKSEGREYGKHKCNNFETKKWRNLCT